MIQEVVQLVNMRVKIGCHYSAAGSTSLLLFLLYMMLLLISANCFPVELLEVHKRQSPSPESLRTECHRSNSTCDYYSHCIEPMFPCGETGFTLDYAQKRCHALRSISSSDTSGPVVRWTHEAELCFQRKLHKLVKDYRHRSLTPDPPTCLRLERSAIAEMNHCYSVNNKLCSKILGNDVTAVSDRTQQELHRVVDSLRLGGAYYETMVNRGVPESVRECGHSELANALQSQPLPQRIVLCTFANRFSGNLTLTLQPSFFINKLATEFDVHREQFVYNRIDEDSLCERNAPDGYNSESEEVIHLITWFADSTHPIVSSPNITRYNDIPAANGPTIYFELNYFGSVTDPLGNRERSTCGNGLREAGEVCDYAGVGAGCSLSCEAAPLDEDLADVLQYECSTERLEPSTCWEEECGDGVRTSSEQCDDGSSDNGCSRLCQITQGHTCTQEYNKTSVCSLTPTHPPPPITSTASPPTVRTDTTSPPPIRVSNLGLSNDSRSQHSSRTSTLTVVLSTLLALCVIHRLAQR